MLQEEIFLVEERYWQLNYDLQVLAELRESLHAEDDNGDDDHKDGNQGNGTSRIGALRILEKQPELSVDLIGRQRNLNFFDEAFCHY